MSDRAIEHVLLCPTHGKIVQWVEGPGQESRAPLTVCPMDCGKDLDHRIRTVRQDPVPRKLGEWQ